VNVALEITPDSLKFEKEKGKMHSAVNVLGVAYRKDGSVGARFSDIVNLDLLDKGEVDKFKKQPLHYENQFDIASGEYNFTVVFSSGGENFGKLQTPLVVEPYQTGEFALSGLALSKQARRTADPATGLDASLLEDRTPLISSGVQIVPMGSNVFKKSDKTTAFYFEVYEPLLVGPQDAANPTVVAIQMRILDRKSGEQKVDTGLLRLDLPNTPGNPVIPVAERLPVDGLTPGSYQLELTALDTANKSSKRVADFELQ
jgi:hypothetical protein